MFSDTHFHFELLSPQVRRGILESMAKNNCAFALDIGTKSGDLAERQNLVFDEIRAVSDPEIQKRISSFFFFSAGIWPSVDAIQNRDAELRLLEQQIDSALKSENPFFRKVCALGECGLDHHWNPGNADKRSLEDFDDGIFFGEQELFEAQLALAKKYSLPVVVHSRDAFEGTLSCIKNSGYDNGIIHCFSYGIDEARAFLDRGWYLAFGGGVTYTKKSKFEQLKELLRFVPDDRILLETDAPYLAPVPFRGTENSPLLIEHTYRFIADIRGVEPEQLSRIVDGNLARVNFGS